MLKLNAILKEQKVVFHSREIKVLCKFIECIYNITEDLSISL